LIIKDGGKGQEGRGHAETNTGGEGDRPKAKKKVVKKASARADDNDSDSSWSDYDEEDMIVRSGREGGIGDGEGKAAEKADVEEEEEEEEGGGVGGGFEDQLKSMILSSRGGGKEKSLAQHYDADDTDDDTDDGTLDFEDTDSESPDDRTNHPIHINNPYDDFADDLSDDLDDLSDPENPNEKNNPTKGFSLDVGGSDFGVEDSFEEAEIKRIYQERLKRTGITDNHTEARAISPGDSPSKVERGGEAEKMDFSKSLPSPLKMKQQQQKQQQQQRQRQKTRTIMRTGNTMAGSKITTKATRPTESQQQREQNFSFDMKPGQRMRIMKKSKLTRGNAGKASGENNNNFSF